MHKIISKTYELIDTLEKSTIIKNITESKAKIKNNQKLLNLIKKTQKETNNTKLIKLKQEIYKDKDYKKYIDNYNQLNYLIIAYNQKIKKLTNTRSCFK